jgi:hypothetical protein
MNCVNHADREAVGQCEVCGAGLCEECYSYFSPHLCHDCAVKLANEDRRTLHKALIIGIISGVIGLALGILLWVTNKGMGPGMGIFFCLWFPMAGIAFGLSVSANAHKKQNFITWVAAFLFSFIVAPVSFTLYLVKTIKMAKIVKNEQQLLAHYLQETPETVAASLETPASEVKEPQAVASLSTSAGPFHQLFDPNYPGDVTFENGNQESMTFVQGGYTHLHAKTYAVLQPKPLPEGMKETEALVFEIKEDPTDLENSEMTLVSDEALCAEVFAALDQGLDEGPSAASLVRGPSSKRQVKWWHYLIMAIPLLLGWGNVPLYVLHPKRKWRLDELALLFDRRRRFRGLRDGLRAPPQKTGGYRPVETDRLPDPGDPSHGHFDRGLLPRWLWQPIDELESEGSALEHLGRLRGDLWPLSPLFGRALLLA